MNKKLVLGALLVALVAGAFALGPGSITVKDWYPKGGEYIFVCNPPFDADTYDWDFGDGEKLYDVTNKEVFHRYSHNGAYPVSCTATSGETTHIMNEVFDVDTAEAQVTIAPWFPQGRNYVFYCETPGVNAVTFDWDFGDGQKMYDVANDNVWHTFASGGQKVVSCTGTSAYGTTVIGYLHVDVAHDEA